MSIIFQNILQKRSEKIAHNGARAIRRDAQAGARARRSGMAYSPSYAEAAQRTKRNSGGPAPRYAKAAQRISHNVPAVCDVFLRPIKKLRGSFRAQKNVGGARRGNGA